MYIKLEWLGFVFIVLAIVLVLFGPTKRKAEQAKEHANKVEAFYPDTKFDSYVKGFSKQTAEFLFPAPHSEINARGAIHKTPQMAKNFFTELKELFK
jgi:hypothetical protein